MDAHEIKFRLISIKRKLNQNGREVQEMIDDLDGKRERPRGNSKNYVPKNREGFQYREDRM